MLRIVLYLLVLVGLVSCYHDGVFHRKHVEYKSDLHLIPNAVDLESITFDKVIQGVEVVVALFMQFLSHGHEHFEFKKFAESTHTQPRVLAATVGVRETDEKNNWDIAERYEITTDSLPQILLFVNGTLKTRFSESEWNCDTYREFIKKYTGLWIGRSGSIEYFDRVAEDFINARLDGDREKLIDQAIIYANTNISDPEIRKSADYYIRVMEEYVNRQGSTFLNLESARLKKLGAIHKFHHAHTCGIKKEMNILQSFLIKPVHLPHDEL